MSNLLYRWRVRAALFVLIAVLVLARPSVRSIAVGMTVCALGLLIRGWAAGHIRKEKTLAVSGPYRYTRNPLYVGNFILGLSMAVGANSLWCIGLFVAYFLVFYPPVIMEELRRMKRLFPALRRRAGDEGARFSWGLYRRNHETRALLGSGIVWAVLIAKTLAL
jgi:protein-S-isoprenylcysteine O-methyltransferase Ste14